MTAQDDAIQHGNGHARVVAGPGTGKTSVLIRRIEHLIRDRGVVPSSVVAVTFTDAAGRELRQRLENLDPALPGLPSASTLHSFAFRHLRLRTGSAFVGERVLDAWEIRQLLCEDLGRRVGRSGAQVNELLAEYDAAWRTLEEPAPSAFRATFETELETLRRVFDFALPGELVYKFKRFLDGEPGYIVEASHYLVDEYQDLNACELAVVEELASRSGAEVFVAGDDDQCIYRFRHAQPDGLREFGDTYDGATDYLLDQCHRCAEPILEAALRLMEHEEGRIPKNIHATHGEGEVRVVSYPSVQQQTAGVRDLVLQHLEAGVTPEDILVLVPRRSMAQGLVDALLETGAHAVNAADPDQALNDEAVRRLIFAIRFTRDEADAVAIRGWLRCTDGIGPGTARVLVDAALEEDISFIDACRASSADRVVGAMEELEALAHRIRDSDTFEDVLEEAEEAGFVPGALDHLRSLIEQLHAMQETPQTGIEVLEQLEEEEAEPEALTPGAVAVTTFRKAKGLTAEVVVVTDLDDDVIPGDTQGEDLAEQRRLLYVTMTRARRALYLTHPATRFGHPTSYAGAGHHAPGNYRQRSRFLNEIGIPSE